MTLKSFKNTIVAAFVVLVANLGTISCTEQNKNEVFPIEVATTTTSDFAVGAEPPADPTAPVIKAITTSLNGEKSYFPDKKDVDYSAYLQANNSGTSKISISGSNFGKNTGTVAITGGYSVTNITWTPTLITGILKCEATSVAGTAVFTVTNVDKKKQSLSKLVCPFLNTRRYGQCTFEGTKGRILRGLIVPAKAYDKTADISGTYLATAGDILHWAGHQASVTSVVQDTKDNNKYTISTSEMNGWVGSGAILTHSYVIVFNRDKDGKIVSRKSGNYFSSLYKTKGAISYYH